MPRGKKDALAKKFLKSIFNLFNLEIKRKNNFEDRYNDFVVEIDKNENLILNSISEYTLSSRANQWSIIQSLKHIRKKNIPGAIIECGVYKGGSLILISLMAQKLNLKNKIYGFDTFEKGFDKISEFDLDPKGKKIDELKFEKNFFPTINEVKDIFNKFNINEKFLPKLIEGKTQNTLQIKDNVPEEISFLRLDTDIYEPTLNQLEILYPKLCSGGILHIDDYGHCPGVKKAVDDYFKDQKIWLHRIDYTCRLLIKN